MTTQARESLKQAQSSSASPWDRGFDLADEVEDPMQVAEDCLKHAVRQDPPEGGAQGPQSLRLTTMGSLTK